jgi:hypothetical protein
MYDTTLVSERIGIAREELGFELEYHSVDDVETFNQKLERKYADEYADARAKAAGAQFPEKELQTHLMGVLNDKSNPRLSSEEVRFIQNEKYLSMCDCAYWMSRYFWIKNTKNILQRYTFRPAQKVYFDVISYLERQLLAIEILVNKARQLGLSTATEGVIAHSAIFNYGVSATIASYDQSKTGEMSKMLFLAYDMTPWWMRPLHTRRVESDRGMLMFGGQRSGVLFQHGTQAGGISQGTTPTVYHLSEVAYYPDAEQLIEIGLFKAVHPSPKVFGVLESTAAGDTGWWHDKYWYYKRNWPNCRMLSLFLPWFLGTDLYPNETDLRKNPAPRDWRPLDETFDMIARAELYVQTNPALSKVLGANWKMGREQAWWWETGFKEARDSGKEKTFYQEYPTDDYESFQGSYESVFGREVIEVVDNRRSRDYQAYGIIGQSIEDKNEPDPEDVDYTKPRVPVGFVSPRGEKYQWELVPLRYKENWDKLSDIREVEIPNGMLMIFAEPVEGYEYSIGVDTSTGIGDESTVIAACRQALGDGEPDKQVCEFRSNLVSHVEAYPYVMCIASYYSRFMERTTAHRQPLVTIEQVQAVGDTVYKDMLKMGYSRFFRFTRYDSRPKDMKKSKSHKTGWFTNAWSRPILTDNFVVAVQNGWYEVNSPWTIWEMAHWETHSTASGKEKKVHSSDSTDDGIFANAMAYLGPNDLKSLTERSKKRNRGPLDEEKLPAIDLGEYGMRVSVVSPAEFDLRSLR